MINSHSLNFKFEILRKNVVYKQVKAEASGEITCDASAAIKRSISCTLELPEDVNMLTDELKVTQILDGVESSLGVFMVTTIPRRVSEEGRITYNVEGYDRTYRVYRRRLEKRSDAFISAGTKYIDAINGLLLACGIENSLIENSQLTLSSDREDWDIGTSYLDIINTLLDEMNYNSLWFDSEGNARAETYESPITKPVDFDYRAGKKSIVLRQHSAEEDYYDAYNVFIVGVSAMETGAESIYVRAENNDIDSKISTVYRGRIMAPVVMLDSVADEQTAQKYADNLVFKSRISSESATIETAIEPGHEVRDIVSLDIPELKGKFEEVGWTIPLTVGLMTHKLRRAIYV